MEILTLLKANIRHKKGSFVSIILLMIIISMSMTSIFSVQDNYKASIDDALEQVDAGDITVYMKSEKLTDELFNSVKNHDMFERVKTDKAIVSTKAEANGKIDVNSCFLRRLSSAIGSVLSVSFSGKFIVSLLRMAGITNIAMEYTADLFIVPICVICARLRALRFVSW